MSAYVVSDNHIHALVSFGDLMAMTIKQASDIIGSQPKQFVSNMHKALGMHSWNNTADDDQRREAARIVLRHWAEHCTHQQSKKGKAK